MPLPLIAAIPLPNNANAEINDELHRKCIEAKDDAWWVKTNKKLSSKKIKKSQGFEFGFP